MTTSGPNNADWLKPARFIGLLALLTLASFPQIVLGIQTFVMRDFGNFSYPVAHYFRESFWRGEIPLWNPLSFCGLPFLAQWNTQALYPPALFYLVFPLSWSLSVFCLLHLFWGGLGMFHLARNWTQNHFAAAFAGIVFAFNGLMLNSVVWPSIIAGLAWMPWVIWLTERAWREGRNRVAIAAIVGALQMLSGAVEVVASTWMVLAALGLVDLILGKTPRRKTFFRTALVVLLISGLSAAQLVPFFDLLNHSHRQENFYASQWPMPPTGWLNFLVPMFHYQSTGNGCYDQSGQFWTTSYYVGVIAVAMAASAVCQVRGVRIVALAALTVFCLVLALGEATPIYNWLRHYVKILNLMRFPIKFVILPVFALPLLAAHGLAIKPPAGRRQEWLVWMVPVILIAVIIGLAYRFQAPTDDYKATLYNALTRVAFLTVIVGGLLLLRRTDQPRLQQLLQVLVLLVVWLDLYCHLPQQPTIARAAYGAGFDRNFPALKPGISRADIPDAALLTLIFASSPDAAADFNFHRFTLFSNCNLMDDVPKCDGFFPLYTREIAMLPTNTVPMLNFLGVSEILAWNTNTFWWMSRSNALPMITGGQKPIFTSDEATLQMLASTNFDPRTEVFLPLGTRNIIVATNPATVKVTPGLFSAQRIEATVVAEAPAMVVVAQTYYHPWHAYVDGKPAPLFRANYAYQALEIPVGSHQVKLVYEDRAFYLGATISLVALAGCLVFLYFGRSPRPVLESRI